MPITQGKKEYFKASPEALKELADWEKKKESYVQSVQPILRKWELQFEKLFSSYTEEIKAASKSFGLNTTTQDQMVAQEFEKFETCKKQLFQVSQNASIKVVTTQVTARRQAIELSNKITLIQAVVRRWLARRRYRELQKNERQRNKCAYELLETEKTYVKNLEILVTVFHNPLRQLSKGPEPLVSADDLTKIFSNCELIYNIHTELLANIEARMSKWSKNQLVGDIFEKWAPFLKLYTQYVSNYNIALTTLADCKKKDSAVDEFFKDAQNRPELGKKNFADYQILPVQRIPRYEMLFKEMIKYTGSNHPDYIHLSNALSKIQAVASKINESKRVAENLDKILAIQAYFVGKFDDLVQPHRNYLKEGVLFYDNPKKAIQRANSRRGSANTFAAPVLDECYAFLMTDILILSHKKASLLDPTLYRYSLVAAVKLLYATIEPLSALVESKHGFSLLANQVVYSLYFDTLKARDEWMDCITKTITFLDKNISTLKIEEPIIREPNEKHKASRLSMVLQIAGDFASSVSLSHTATQSAPMQTINLNPPSVNANNTTTAPAPSSPQPVHTQISPQKPPLPTGNSYKNLNTGSPSATRASSSKIKQALGLYEEAFQAELAIFQVPIDLKTLFPTYYQQLPPNYQQLIWTRVFALKQKIEQIDGFHDRVISVLKSEKIALQLEKAILEGRTPIGNLQTWVKEQYPASNPLSQQPRALLIELVKWLQALLKTWEQVLEEECN